MRFIVVPAVAAVFVVGPMLSAQRAVSDVATSGTE